MVKKEVHNSHSVSDSTSQTVCLSVDDWVFLSGMMGQNNHGEIIDYDIETQFRKSIENIESVLRSAGSDLSNIYNLTIWITDMRDADKVRRICDELLDTEHTLTISNSHNFEIRDAKIKVEARAVKSNCKLKKEALSVESIDEKNSYQPVGIKIDDLIYISGQIGEWSDQGDKLPKPEDQINNIFQNIDQILSENNSSAKDILHMTNWVDDIRNTKYYTQARSQLLDKDVTTSTRLGVTELKNKRTHYQLEVTAVDSGQGKSKIQHPDGLPLSTTKRNGEEYPRYWQCVTAGDWVFTAGMVAVDEDFTPVSRQFRPQAIKTLDNIEKALKAAGSNWDDLVHSRCYLKDMRYFKEYNKIRQDIIGDTPATNSVIHSPSLAMEPLLLEVEAIAKK